MTLSTDTTTLTARALWYVASGQVALRDEQISAVPTADEVLVRTLFSAISRGTERLVFLGSVPESEWQTMKAPKQLGSFPFPVKYGYCAVGRIERGPAELKGHVAFCLHPHQDLFLSTLSEIQLIPVNIPIKRATLTANMETALNAIWDSGIKLGDRVNVIGAGIVGLLVAYLASRIPGTDVTLVDVDASRKAIATAIGVTFAGPQEAPAGADVVFHTSATAAGLQAAIDAAGFEARIVELSWFGTRSTPLCLGGAFHSKRLQIISTQVGFVATVNRPRWDYRRRMAKAAELLDDPALDALVGEEIPFEDLERHLPAVFADKTSGLPPLIRYPAG